MRKLITASLFALLGISASFAQGNDFWCTTDNVHRTLFDNNPGLEDHFNETRQAVLDKMHGKSGYDDSTVYTITVVFHIVHEYGAENITDAQIYDAMKVVNREFGGVDPDASNLLPPYDNLNAQVNIQYKLAAIDPFGNCTNGIDHIYSHMTNIGTDYAKLNQWDRTRYMNIWVSDVVGEAGAAAYAYKPGATDGNNFWIDGVIAFHNYTGSIGTSSTYRETTITHELGHTLGLSHTWGDGNDPEVSCGDDGVSDTPITKGHNPGTNCSGTYPYGWVDCGDDGMSSIDPTDSLNWYTFDSIIPGIIDTLTPVPAPNNTELGTPGAIYSEFSASGVGTAPTETGGTFGFDGWDTGAADGETVFANLTGSINTAKYYEFTVQPATDQAMFLNNLRFDVARDTMGPRTWAVRSSVDGYATNLPISINPTNSAISAQAGDVFFYNNDTTTLEKGSNVDLSSASFTTMSPITFRIYAWNAEGAAGDFIVDNVRLNGTFGLLEDLQNYMDYSYCPYHYSPEQKKFMRTVLNEIAGFRNNLFKDSTLLSTGVYYLNLPQDPSDQLTVPLCEPIVDFTTTKHTASGVIQRTTCVGDNIQFFDASYNAVIDTWAWEFKDGAGVVQTSSQMNPTISFANPGFVDVTLTVGNTAGSTTLTRNDWIYVGPGWADYNGPAQLNIETQADWFRVVNPEENYAKYAVVSGKGYNGSKCFKLNNYKNTSGADPYNDDYFYYPRLNGSKDYLITPSFDLRYTTGVSVSFKYAYATNATQLADISEKLITYYSEDCGKTWVPKTCTVNGSPQPGGISGASLISGGFAGFEDYVPTGNQDWRTGTFTYTGNAENVLFMFGFQASSQSSNLYIDEIWVDGSLGLVSDEISSMDISVYPNPTANGQALTVNYNAQDNPVEFILKDAQGKIVAQEVVEETNTTVNHTLKGTDNLNAACYFLEVISGEHKTTRKVVVL